MYIVSLGQTLLSRQMDQALERDKSLAGMLTDTYNRELRVAIILGVEVTSVHLVAYVNLE